MGIVTAVVGSVVAFVVVVGAVVDGAVYYELSLMYYPEDLERAKELLENDVKTYLETISPDYKELLIPILCGIFLVENLSVILQVKYFQAGKKKGKKQRIFKRTPIHDHFRITMAQLDPDCSYMFTKPTNVYHESKITVRFWIVTIILAAITIITLKIR